MNNNRGEEEPNNRQPVGEQSTLNNIEIQKNILNYKNNENKRNLIKFSQASIILIICLVLLFILSFFTDNGKAETIEILKSVTFFICGYLFSKPDN